MPMFCQECGKELPAEAVRCGDCGHWIAGPPKSPQYKIEDDAGMRMLLPVGRTGLSIAAGYLGLFSLILPLAPVALVVSIIAIADIGKHPEKRGMGRAVFGMIMGVLFTILLFVVVYAVATAK